MAKTPGHASGLPRLAHAAAVRNIPGLMLGVGLFVCGCAEAAAQASRSTPPTAAITNALLYDANALANVHGGARRGSDYEGMLRWQISIDGDRALGLPDTSAYINTMAIHHAGPAELTGDAQGVSNMAAPSGVRIEEAWVQRNFLEGRLSALIGRYDLNSEFYRLNSAGLFLNSSFGIGPEFSGSGRGGPSRSFPRLHLACGSSTSRCPMSSFAQPCSMVCPLTATGAALQPFIVGTACSSFMNWRG